MLKAKKAFKIYKKRLEETFPCFLKTVDTAIKLAAHLGEYETDVFVTESSLKRGLKNVGPYLESLGYSVDINEAIYYSSKDSDENCIPFNDASFQKDIDTFKKSKGGKVHIVFAKPTIINYFEKELI